MSEKQIHNPANTPEKEDRKRVPMSIPVQKLQVPEKEGWHRHWMIGTPQRIAQALRAGYRFVDPNDADIVNTGLADDASASGNTDMGTRVSVVAGGTYGDDGQAERLYLMEIEEYLWSEDQRALEDRNERIAMAIRGGQDLTANPEGNENRYIPEGNKKAMANLFTRKSRRT